MANDLKTVLDRAQGDYRFYIAIQENPRKALRKYDLTDRQRELLSDGDKLGAILTGTAKPGQGESDVAFTITISGTHDWFNPTNVQPAHVTITHVMLPPPPGPPPPGPPPPGPPPPGPPPPGPPPPGPPPPGPPPPGPPPPGPPPPGPPPPGPPPPGPPPPGPPPPGPPPGEVLAAFTDIAQRVADIREATAAQRFSAVVRLMEVLG